MRPVVAVAFAALVVVYAAVAVRLFVQEKWALETPEEVDPAVIGNPEVTLALVQERFQFNRFRGEELTLLRRALLQVPSFYEPPFLLATFQASRASDPDAVRRSYGASIERYPANGRLHLAFGTWLLESRAGLDGWRSAEHPGELRDPLPLAESHLKTAMSLEPDLAGHALAALARNRIPAARWKALVPDHPLSRPHLLEALFQAGEVETVWELLREDLLSSEDPHLLRRIVHWGLEGGRPDIALQAAERWMGLAESSERGGAEVLEPVLWVSRAHLAMNEPEAAYEALEQALGRVEARFGATSLPALDILNAMGREYMSRGHPVTAEAIFRQAVSRRPSYVPALLGLARALRDTGEYEESAVRYEEVLRLEPSNDPAKSELASLLALLAKMGNR